MTVVASLAVPVAAFQAPPDDPDSVVAGSVWRYLADGSNQGSAWRNVGFNDASWSTGAAQLGYGDGDEATVVPRNGLVSYYHREFTVNNPAAFTSPTLELIRDDGGGGVSQWCRDRSTKHAWRDDHVHDATFDHCLWGDKSDFHTHVIDPGLLQTGTNVIAIQIFNHSPGSSDISLDLALTAG